MGIHQLIGAFAKEFGFTLLALIPLTFFFFRKMYSEYSEKKENDNIKNVELLIQWFNEHGLPKDKFISEQLIQKRFGFLINYEVMEWILSKENPSSNFYKFRYTSSYINFDSAQKTFTCKGKWTVSKLEKYKVFQDVLSFLSLFAVFIFMAVIIFNSQQGFDLATFSFCGAYSFGSLLFSGACITTSLGVKGSLELLKT
ncbi:hypothetical protein CWC17_08680 [Pseudoalteromonas sp. S3785]|uniref:hypothetical protein n=1 Tax=Pseudoalteromonas sp. S3785 TaxID=579545 RepID=UPI00110BB256|nr:hypothetical protein [Pseudoalteromonas sp. S3785]TMO74260.1 hypothetical protein CWC17_08680 [Pseudoalteromonas sp. S3785]